MRPGRPLARRTPLRATSRNTAQERATSRNLPPSRATTPPKPARSSRTTVAALQVPGPIRTAVYARDGYRCQACGKPSDLSIQHRRARGMGGTTDPAINRPSNLVTLCGSGNTGCHGDAEAHPVAATRAGWRVPPGTDPEQHPYTRYDGAVVFLADDLTIRLEAAA